MPHRKTRAIREDACNRQPADVSESLQSLQARDSWTGVTRIDESGKQHAETELPLQCGAGNASIGSLQGASW
ncbi:MAG: hypothetical protein R3B90_23705 [Planctomycetaceae bacterium]